MNEIHDITKFMGITLKAVKCKSISPVVANLMIVSLQLEMLSASPWRMRPKTPRE